MLNQIEIEINVAPVTLKYWIAKGYLVTPNSIHLVKISDLPEKSNQLVDCICDCCNRNYKQRFSRNKDVCGSCLLQNRMLGNKYKKSKIVPPPKEELLAHIKSGIGKVELCKIYNVDF